MSPIGIRCFSADSILATTSPPSRGFQCLMQYAISCGGLCLWPTRIGTLHRGMKAATTSGQVTTECRRYGLYRMAYFLVVWDSWGSRCGRSPFSASGRRRKGHALARARILRKVMTSRMKNHLSSRADTTQGERFAYEAGVRARIYLGSRIIIRDHFAHERQVIFFGPFDGGAGSSM